MAPRKTTPTPAVEPETAPEPEDVQTPAVEPETDRPVWETVPGGRYRNAADVIVDAEGREIK